MRDIAKASVEEQLRFFNSFDQILCDVDGVISLLFKPIKGSAECINTLESIGKKVAFVSNNSTITVDNFITAFKSFGIDVNRDQVIIPPIAFVEELKKNNFDKVIFLIGSPALKEELINAGFKVIQGPGKIEFSIQKLLLHIKDDEHVGAVIIDIDINVSYVDLQKAATFLKREEVLFLSGSQDSRLPVAPDTVIMGIKNFTNALEEFTGRTAKKMTKPSENYFRIIMEKLHCTDPHRTLFIGDSVVEDMGFATKFSCHKLLVLSGVTKEQHLENWVHPEDWKPEFYVKDLCELKNILDKVFGK